MGEGHSKSQQSGDNLANSLPSIPLSNSFTSSLNESNSSISDGHHSPRNLPSSRSIPKSLSKVVSSKKKKTTPKKQLKDTKKKKSEVDVDIKKRSKGFGKKMFDSSERLQRVITPTQVGPLPEEDYNVSLNEDRRCNILEKSELALNELTLSSSQRVVNQSTLYQNTLQNSTRNVDSRKRRNRSVDTSNDSKLGNNSVGLESSKDSDSGEASNPRTSSFDSPKSERAAPGAGYISAPPKASNDSSGAGGAYIQVVNHSLDKSKSENNDTEQSSNNSFGGDDDSSWGGFGSDSDDNQPKEKGESGKSNDKNNNNSTDSDDGDNTKNPNFLADLLSYFNSLNPEDLHSLGEEVLKKYPKLSNDLVDIVDDYKAEKKLIEGGSDDEEYSSEEMEADEEKDIDHLLDVSCNWNQRFQVCIEMLKHHGQIHEKRVQIFLHLSNLAQDFIHCAKTYGRIIISEAETPIQFKTIRPTKIGGFAGGDKYIVNNILFKFAVDSHNLFDMEEAAIKIAGHDLKGLISYFNLGIEGLHFPLMALVDYLGYRLIAMSVLPIGKNTIVYGSSDAGRTNHNSCPILSYKMQFAARMLNLKKHFVGKTEPEYVEMYSAGDLEGHDVDGVYYLLDFSRSFPPTTYDTRYRNSYLYRLFRSEFVKNYPIPLCPDTYSGFSVDSAENYIMEVEEATKYLINTTIPKFSKTLNEMVDISTLNLKEAMHESGINLRYLGNLRHQVNREDIKQLILVEMIARVIKHQLRSKMRLQMRELKLPLEHSCREMVIEHMNLIFGKSPESEQHFNTTIKEHLLRNFENALTDEEKEASLKGLINKNMCLLFQHVQQMTNLIFTQSAQSEFSSHPHVFEFENPFHVTDLEEIGVRVRHLNIVALAQGYVLKNQARLDGKNSERLCKMALEKFKQALSDNPGDIRALRELADASNILGNKEAADMYYKRATTISNDANTLFKYAVFLEENHKIKEAEEYYLRTLEKDVKHDHCLQRYGHFLESQGNPDSAEKFFIRASEIRSRSSTKHSNPTPNFLF